MKCYRVIDRFTNNYYNLYIQAPDNFCYAVQELLHPLTTPVTIQNADRTFAVNYEHPTGYEVFYMAITASNIACLKQTSTERLKGFFFT